MSPPSSPVVTRASAPDASARSPVPLPSVMVSPVVLSTAPFSNTTLPKDASVIGASNELVPELTNVSPLLVTVMPANGPTSCACSASVRVSSPGVSAMPPTRASPVDSMVSVAGEPPLPVTDAAKSTSPPRSVVELEPSESASTKSRASVPASSVTCGASTTTKPSYVC